MLNFTLSPAAEQWIKIVLIWIGFGAVAGLLATVIFPTRRRIGAFGSIVAGVAGSTAGLFSLGWLFPGREIHPFNPLGFLAAVVGAVVLLALWRLAVALFGKPNDAHPD